MPILCRLKLIIVHSHYRPGGVRRIIELATPHLVAALRPAASEVIMVGGEMPGAAWTAHFAAQLKGVRVSWLTDRILGYTSELPAALRAPTQVPRLARRIHRQLERVLREASAGDAVVWAHNQGLGRNLLVTRALQQLCLARGVPLLLHHHDWWFDNRWARWPEMRQAGFRTLGEVAHTLLPAAPNIRHLAINQPDAVILQRHFGRQAAWLPNLSERAARAPRQRVSAARRWLARELGGDVPVWLVPCRLLRRKNLAEALLLTRWLRPEAWLVTTGGASSADEHAYAGALAAAARRNHWPLRLAMLDGREGSAPAVSELIESSEAILLTSLQEGFGLPNLEATAAGRPLIARRLPNIAPDLARFGFRFPHAYDEVRVDPGLFDWRAEVQRQQRRWRAWRARLPAGCRPPVGAPTLLAEGNTAAGVPFSRLTLVAQLEVLAGDPSRSWAACAPLNPFLQRWRILAAAGALKVAPWPERASRWLSGPAYAARWIEALHAGTGRELRRQGNRNPGLPALQEFIRAKLARENQFPLLWTSEP